MACKRSAVRSRVAPPLSVLGVLIAAKNNLPENSWPTHLALIRQVGKAFLILDRLDKNYSAE